MTSRVEKPKKKKKRGGILKEVSPGLNRCGLKKEVIERGNVEQSRHGGRSSKRKKLKNQRRGGKRGKKIRPGVKSSDLGKNIW